MPVILILFLPQTFSNIPILLVVVVTYHNWRYTHFPIYHILILTQGIHHHITHPALVEVAIGVIHQLTVIQVNSAATCLMPTVIIQPINDGVTL